MQTVFIYYPKKKYANVILTDCPDDLDQILCQSVRPETFHENGSSEEISESQNTFKCCHEPCPQNFIAAHYTEMSNKSVVFRHYKNSKNYFVLKIEQILPQNICCLLFEHN